MKSADPIVNAKSVSALMVALNEVYHWKLPESFPAHTPLGELWSIAITVTKDPKTGVLYLATATEPYGVSANLPSGTVYAKVLAALQSTLSSVPTPSVRNHSRRAVHVKTKTRRARECARPSRRNR